MAGIVFLLASERRVGWAVTIGVVAIGAVVAPPRALVGGDILGISLTPAAIAIAVLSLLGLLSLDRKNLSLRFLPLLAYVFIIGGLAWSTVDRTMDGIGLLMFGVLAWAAGSVAAGMLSDRPGADRTLAWALLLLVGLQAVVTVLQALGYDVFSTVSEAGELTEGRANGMFGHPGTLGKNIVLLVLVAIPLTTSKDSRSRRLAFLALLLSIVPVGLSESRSNFAALVVVLLMWGVLAPRGKGLNVRIALPAGAVVVALMFYDVIAARFLNDPGGGQRGHFMEVALTYIPDHLWVGVGPNGYIPYFGQFDALTAEGWPVHNAFVLVVAELGVLGAIFLFVPLLLVPLLRALRTFSTGGPRAAYARTLITAFPAVIILATTGWGLMGGVILPLWMFVFGYLNRRMLEPGEPVFEHGTDADDAASVPTRASRRV